MLFFTNPKWFYFLCDFQGIDFPALLQEIAKVSGEDG